MVDNYPRVHQLLEVNFFVENLFYALLLLNGVKGIKIVFTRWIECVLNVNGLLHVGQRDVEFDFHGNVANVFVRKLDDNGCLWYFLHVLCSSLAGQELSNL